MQDIAASMLSYMSAHQLMFFIIAIVWTLPWQGVALWQAARLSHTWWFIAILLFNTLGILPIIYIFLVARNYTVEEEIEPVVDEE